MGKCVNGLMREKQWKIDKVIEHRRKIANLYKKALLGLGIDHLMNQNMRNIHI